jgi:hypothetical protein
MDLQGIFEAALGNLTNDDIDELTGLGVPLGIIPDLVGVMPIQLDRAGRWLPSEGDRLAYITPVRVDLPADVLSLDPPATIFHGTIVDLIAWDPRTPLQWALLTSANTWLGSHYCGEPFDAVLRQSVLSWLQSGCDGIVLLTRDPVEIRGILTAFEHGTRAETRELRDQLDSLVRQPVENFPLIGVLPNAR